MRGKKPTKPEVRREVIAIIAAARRGERDPASEAYETRLRGCLQVEPGHLLLIIPLRAAKLIVR